MSANSNNHGRAYEYAWIKTLQKTLSTIRTTRIMKGLGMSLMKICKTYWSCLQNLRLMKFLN